MLKVQTRLSIKIIATIFSLFAILGILAFSVYAAAMVQFSVNSFITFEATDIKGSIKGEVFNAGEQISKYNYFSEFTPDKKPSSWVPSKGFYFLELNPVMVFQIEIENKGDSDISIMFNTLAATPAEIGVKYFVKTLEIETLISPVAGATIANIVPRRTEAGGQFVNNKLTLKIQFTLTNFENIIRSENNNVNISIKLFNASQPAS